MTKKIQKRKSSEAIPDYGKVTHKISENISNDLSKLNTADIEIIDLNENEIYEELDFVNDEDSDDEWEDVSDHEEIIEIDLNNNDTGKVKDERREILKLQRKELELIHRSMLMCLVGRLKYINTILESEEIKNFFFSIIPPNLSCENELDKSSVKTILETLKSIFKLKKYISDKGDIKDLLLYAIENKVTSSYWLNVIIVGLLRRLGYESRIVSIFYPGPLKLSDLKENKETPGLLCQPTTYKPSTRGKSKKKTTDNTKLVRKSKLLISPDKTDYVNTHKYPMYFFGEILIPNSLYWMSFDVNNLNELDNESFISHKYPFLYAIAVSGDGFMRDVAVRYDDLWCLSSRKLRLPDASYKSILESVVRKFPNDADYVEDARIKDLLALQPQPQTLKDFKGHPVYVLGCDMLKYEVLDPPDTKPICNFRDEPVYLRENVTLAHTAETWLKKAMSVKEGEVPCKHVKTIMSRRREKQGKDPNVDLWGPWQVENYKPPKAENGRVPVNRHGNVDLFKPCMLPEGCVHIRGLNDIDKVCKKLDIHIVPAMVGWAFTKCNSARPILDGWVVCREHIPTLKEGWSEYIQHKLRIEADKRSLRVVKNWGVIVRRLLLRERLRKAYQL